MYPRILNYVICLDCGSSLESAVFRAEDSNIREGYLHCKCGAWYPVINGVPRILPSELMTDLIFHRYPDFYQQYKDRLPTKAQQMWSNALQKVSQKSLKMATAQSFGYEWKRFHRMFDSYRQNFLNYIQPFTESYFPGKVILDAGCGVGRHTYWAGKFGAADAIGMDLSDAVEPAEKNCRELTNVHIVQADIYHPPFKKEFDMVFSIGVLHHLPDPEGGFRVLSSFVKKGGVMLIWVYGRLHNGAAVYMYEPIRLVTRHLPKRLLVPLCHPFAAIVHGLNKISDFFASHPFTAHAATLIPFQYYRQFPYEVKLNDAFDVLATPKSRYYHMQTIKEWFERIRLKPTLQYLRKKSIIGFAYNNNSEQSA